jgi:hypothetical protein
VAGCHQLGRALMSVAVAIVGIQGAEPWCRSCQPLLLPTKGVRLDNPSTAGGTKPHAIRQGPCRRAVVSSEVGPIKRFTHRCRRLPASLSVRQIIQTGHVILTGVVASAPPVPPLTTLAHHSKQLTCLKCGPSPTTRLAACCADGRPIAGRGLVGGNRLMRHHHRQSATTTQILQR